MAILFWILAVLASCGFFLFTHVGDSHRMFYSGVICAVWVLLALWWSGVIG